jgi:Putative hemolysin
MVENSDHLIDIDKILQEKVPNKHVPKMLISYLKHIAHQDELNVFLREYGSTQGVAFVNAALDFLDVKVSVKQSENLPKEGLYTFVSNHPLGAQDGLILSAVLGKAYNEKIKFLVNDLLMTLYGMSPFFIPINKTGKQSRNFPKIIEKGFASDEQLVMFPAGICSRRHKGVIRDVEWKKAFITKSVETHRDVVPIHFNGRNSNFFYNLSNLCQFFGIKFNVAMLLNNAIKKEDYKAVIRICEPGIEATPDALELYFYLAIAYNQAGRTDDAINTSKKALTHVTSDSKKEVISDFYALMGDVYYSKLAKKEAYAAYDSALVYNADNISALNNYAYYLSEEHVS